MYPYSDQAPSSEMCTELSTALPRKETSSGLLSSAPRRLSGNIWAHRLFASFLSQGKKCGPSFLLQGLKNFFLISMAFLEKQSLVTTIHKAPVLGKPHSHPLNLDLMDFPLILLQPRRKTQSSMQCSYSLKYPYKSCPSYSLITAQPGLWLLVLGGNFIYFHIKCFISMQLFQSHSIT
jgi:hypothetical protein